MFGFILESHSWHYHELLMSATKSAALSSLSFIVALILFFAAILGATEDVELVDKVNHAV